jgi:hypothetical protein
MLSKTEASLLAEFALPPRPKDNAKGKTQAAITPATTTTTIAMAKIFFHTPVLFMTFGTGDRIPACLF